MVPVNLDGKGLTWTSCCKLPPSKKVCISFPICTSIFLLLQFFTGTFSEFRKGEGRTFVKYLHFYIGIFIYTCICLGTWISRLRNISLKVVSGLWFVTEQLFKWYLKIIAIYQWYCNPPLNTFFSENFIELK